MILFDPERSTGRKFAAILRAGLILAVLSACATPSPGYLGQKPQIVTLGGRDYRVWHRRSGATGSVQVVRMGYVGRGAHAGIVPAMIDAAEQVSGCRVSPGSVSGDTGVMTAVLTCQP